MNFQELQVKINRWAFEKDLINDGLAYVHLCKITEELGELISADLKGDIKGVKYELGDVLVTLIVYSMQKDIDPIASLEIAWNKIKNRSGETVNGTFVKSNE